MTSAVATRTGQSSEGRLWNRFSTPAIFTATIILLVSFLDDANSLVRAESCWNKWVPMPSPRTSANVLRIGVYGFIVGGTTNAAYDDCREAFENPSSGVICNETFALDVVPVRLIEAFYMDSVGQLSRGIHGRSFAAALHDKIYICYACAWSLTNSQHMTLMEIDVLPRGTFRETPRMPMPSPRGGATMVAYPPDLLFFFGGIISTWPDYHVLIHNVTEPNGGTYFKVMKTEGSPDNICDCTGVASHDTIFLMNCLNCTSQTEIGTVFKFHVPTLSWQTPFSITGNSQAPAHPQIGASPAVGLAQFATSLWPDGYDSPHALMYDMVMNTMMNYPIDQLEQKVRHSATLAVGGHLYLFGGNTYDRPSKVSSIAATIGLLPALPLEFNSTMFDVGQEVTAFANANCLSSSETIRVSTTPSCDRFIETVPAQICAPQIPINTSLIPSEIPWFWMCLTQGSCTAALQPGYNTPCPRAVTSQTECRWQGCCWTIDGRCLASQPTLSESDESSAYWYVVDISPIQLMAPGSMVAPIQYWYAATWFKAVVGLVGAILLYVLIICIWRRRQASSMNSLHSLLNSSASFGAFGKKYRLERKIGQGGFGTVFLAIRKSDDKEVALKYIPCRDPKARDRAIREFDLSQKVRHPNKMECVDLIVQWSDDADSKNNSLLDEMDSGNLKAPASSGSNSTGGSKGSIRSLESESTGLLSGLGGSTKFVCLVMPYYPEGDLRKYTLQHIEHGRPVPSGTVLSVAIQLCDVLHYLHMLDPPIVHRDVKPENILMAENGTKVILTDFGMAVFASTNYVTTRAGTLHYAAPETWKRQFTPACDVWSLGCVLYAVATGLITKDDTRVMFDDVNDDNFETSILTDLSHLGSEVAQIILKMLQRDPDDRISAGAALEAFRGVQLENRIGETLGRIQ